MKLERLEGGRSGGRKPEVWKERRRKLDREEGAMKRGK